MSTGASVGTSFAASLKGHYSSRCRLFPAQSVAGRGRRRRRRTTLILCSNPTAIVTRQVGEAVERPDSTGSADASAFLSWWWWWSWRCPTSPVAPVPRFPPPTATLTRGYMCMCVCIYIELVRVALPPAEHKVRAGYFLFIGMSNLCVRCRRDSY